VSDVEHKEQFYSDLTLVTREFPKHNVIIIGGDINAKIGKRDATGSVLNQNTNDNG